jgi:hypothetical protein
VYVPAATSVNAIGDEDPVAVRPEDDVAVKVVIAELPVWFAVKATLTAPDVPPDAVPIVGASGTDCGTLAGDVADDAADVPAAFVAVTVKVYEEEEAVFRPVTVSGEEDPVAVNPPVFEVTV